MNTTSRSVPVLRQRKLHRATNLQLAGIAIIFGITIWILMAGMDLLATMYNEFVTVPKATLNSLVALACGAMLFKLMISERTRHEQMMVRLHAIAEINHHIRNALDRIELTAHITHNQQLISDIEGGIQRIQWVLRELLPEREEPDND